MLGGDLDEIAEHVVVANFKRADAGLFGIARLQRGDHAAGFVAQAARLVEARVVAFAHEAAVALEGGQFGSERGGQFGGQHAVRAAAGLQRVGDFRRDILQRRQSAGEIGGRQHAVADGGEIARAAAADRQDAPARGRDRAPLAAASACRRAPPRRRRTLATASSRRAIAFGSVSGADSRCAKRREPAEVTVRSIASSSEPRRSPESVRISSRLPRVAWSIAMVAEAASRNGGDSGGRLPICVRST